jgi:hypothetical protein
MAAQAGPTTMATIPPEAEAQREAEAQTEDADAAADQSAAADLSAAAGPTGAAAAVRGESGLAGTITVTEAKLTVLFFYNVFSIDLIGKKIVRFNS